MKTRVLVGFAVLLVTAVSASATTSGDLTEMSLDELLDVRVEIGSIYSETELTVGSAVGLVTREQWDRWGARTIGDALRYEPSMVVLPSFGGFLAMPIRGYTQSMSIRGVAVLLDGVPLNDFWSGSGLTPMAHLGLGGFSRIEMIRGPGSAIYGSDAFHGVVSLHTASAEDNRLLVGVEAGTNGSLTSSAMFSRRTDTGSQISGGASVIEQRDLNVPYAYTDPMTGSPGEGIRAMGHGATSFNVKGRHEFTDRVSLTASVFGSQWDADGHQGAGQEFFSELSGGLGTPSASFTRDRDVGSGESEFFMGKLGSEWLVGDDITVEAAGYLWSVNQGTHIDLTRASELTLAGVVPPSEFTQSVEESRAGAWLEAKERDNRIGLQWLLRYEYSRLSNETASSSFQVDPGITVGPFPEGYSGRGREIHSGLLQTKKSMLANRLHFLLGGRVDGYSDFGTQLSPRVGVVAQLTESSALKLLYGSAFRPPSGWELYGTSEMVGNPDLDPETIDVYEAILVKHGPWWRASLGAFRSEWKNAMEIIITPALRPMFVNKGENRATGVEAEIEWRVDAFDLDVNGSYVESENLSHDFRYDAFPSYIVNAGVGYSLIPHGWRFYLANRLQWDSKDGPYIEGISSRKDLDTYFRTDLSVTKQYHGVGVYALFRNLFDRENRLPSIWNSEGGVADEEFSASVGLNVAY